MQFLLQQSALTLQKAPFGLHVAQSGSVVQSGSAQSFAPSQSLLRPSLHLPVSVAGGVPQSAGHLHLFSPTPQVPLPQVSPPPPPPPLQAPSWAEICG